MMLRYAWVPMLAMVLASSCGQNVPDAGATAPQSAPPVDQRGDTNTKESAMGVPHAVPEAVRSLIEANDEIVAYKPLDEASGALAVMIVRHKLDESSDSQKNPCDLLVLQGKNGAFSVADKTDKAVDCLYNDLARKAASLEENLQVMPGKISYNNQGEKSTVRYDFIFSTERSAWHLGKVVSAYPKYNEATDSTDVLGSEVEYPKDLGWIPMSSFDPEAIQDALDKNRKLIE